MSVIPPIEEQRPLHAPFVARLVSAASLLWQSKLATFGGVIFLSILAVGAAAPLIVPSSVVRDVRFAAKLMPPDAEHWFGTDDFGRDLFSLVLLAANLDLRAALTVVLAALTVGTGLGALAGLVGKLDEPLMRITDVFLSIPSLVLAMAIASVLGRSVENLSIALIFVSWPIYCRLMRGQVLSEKEKPYVKALQTLGVGHARMILKHIIPNTIFPVIARAPTDVGLILITLAALSYIGFGPGPYVPEWGSLVAAGQAYIFQAPWLVIFPGLAIFLTSLSLNLLGDWARDVFDPRLRR